MAVYYQNIGRTSSRADWTSRRRRASVTPRLAPAGLGVVAAANGLPPRLGEDHDDDVEEGPGSAVRSRRAAPVSASIQQEVEALAALDLEGLRAAWRRRYGTPPRLRSIELLRLLLAWRLQAQALGGLDQDTRRQLKRTGSKAESLSLGVGTRLRREWQGRIVEVEVEAAGFRWESTRYPSLSAAASAIAGSRWNGPRFFGLREARP